MRAVIFANGEFGGLEEIALGFDGDECVIAANGGTRHALAAGMQPDVVIGDLDSLGADEREHLTAVGARLIPFSPRKDETDLELALLHAVDVGATEIVILGALGGRLDQTIANLLLLALPELSGIDVRIVDGPQTASLIRPGSGAVTIQGAPGDTVSLLPLSADATGVTAQGLEWSLDGATLRFGRARGVSNVLREHQASIELAAGLLLCVVIRQGDAIG
jgi:thiamine pyrophosphokinase